MLLQRSLPLATGFPCSSASGSSTSAPAPRGPKLALHAPLAPGLCSRGCRCGDGEAAPPGQGKGWEKPQEGQKDSHPFATTRARPERGLE